MLITNKCQCLRELSLLLMNRSEIHLGGPNKCQLHTTLQERVEKSCV